MTKIALMSDLHLEFSFFDIRNSQHADFLILSGDILIAEDLHDIPRGNGGYVGQQQRRAEVYRRFLQQASDEFEHIIYVAGNHEFYHGKWYAGLDYLREECNHYGIHFLECNSISFADHQITFLGGTLWTDMNNRDPITLHSITNMINDYNHIRNDRDNFRKIRPSDTVQRHAQTVTYIKNTLEQLRTTAPNHKIVVVGHHGPSYKSIPECYRHDTLANGAYASDLSAIMLDYPEIALWTAGHTHLAYQYTIGSTSVVCNPRGYQGDGNDENTGWDPNLIIDI